MLDERIELVRQGYDAWNSGDRRWVLEHMTPDAEWVQPRDDPDARTYEGHEAILEFWAQWRAAVGDLRFEPLELDLEGGDVIVRTRRSGRGTHSGLEVNDEVIQVFSFDEQGRCCRIREFYDRDEAIASLAGTEAERDEWAPGS
jgi:ketosteroid isomerase-like protein